MTQRTRPAAISETTVHRLSLLLRCLRLLDAEGISTTSSRALSERFGLNSAQIRKDLAQFGEFGVRGLGYRIPELMDRLKDLLGLTKDRVVVIVGAGHLGLALADSRNFNTGPFRVGALFDVDRRKVGSRSRTGIEIRSAADMTAIVKETKALIGVLAVPAELAPRAAADLVESGIRAILNFTAATVGPFRGVSVKNVDLTLFLENLSFQLATGIPGEPDAKVPPRPVRSAALTEIARG